jgi:hypothetical protein
MMKSYSVGKHRSVKIPQRINPASRRDASTRDAGCVIIFSHSTERIIPNGMLLHKFTILLQIIMYYLFRVSS